MPGSRRLDHSGGAGCSRQVGEPGGGGECSRRSGSNMGGGGDWSGLSASRIRAGGNLLQISSEVMVGRHEAQLALQSGVLMYEASDHGISLVDLLEVGEPAGGCNAVVDRGESQSDGEFQCSERSTERLKVVVLAESSNISPIWVEEDEEGSAAAAAADLRGAGVGAGVVALGADLPRLL